MQFIGTDWVVWSVCRFVMTVSPAKMAQPIVMAFGMLTRVGPRNHVLGGRVGVQIPRAKGQFWGAGKGQPFVKYWTVFRELCKNGRTDWDAVWNVDSGEPKESCIRWGPDSRTSRGNFEDERSRPRTCPAVDILKMTQQGVAPVCQLGVSRWVDSNWGHLVNTTEPSMCCSNVLQVTLTIWWLLCLHVCRKKVVVKDQSFKPLTAWTDLLFGIYSV